MTKELLNSADNEDDARRKEHTQINTIRNDEPNIL